MKKVWILEKFETHEEMVKFQNETIEMLESAKVNDADDAKVLEEFVAKYNEVIRNNPNGRWIGFEGKSNYRQFCAVAKDTIRRNPNSKFRVVEGEIREDAKFWVGYNFVKENEGVLRYLMATK